MAEKSNLVQIGALWNQDSDKAPLAGKLGNANLVILANSYKEEDKHPDFVVCVATPEKRDKEDTGKKRRFGKGSGNNDDDVPF